MNFIRNFPRESHKMTSSWNTIKHNWLINLVNKFVFLLILFSLVVLALRWSSLPPLVPLWYSRPWGADQLAHPFWLFLLPVSGLLVHAINFFITIYFTLEYLTFTQMLFLASLIVNILSFVTLIKILFLIT